MDRRGSPRGFSVVINYVDRSNLSLAMPLLERQFSFSSLRAGELLAAFFWTYALVQLFGLAGWLTDRFPVGWVLLLGYLLWSTGHGSYGADGELCRAFRVADLLLGIGESVAYPCYSRIFAAMPQEHRGRANALIDAGTKLGPAAGAFVGGMVLVHFGWRMLFVVFGWARCVWLLPWYFAMPRGAAKRAGARRARDRRATPTHDPPVPSRIDSRRWCGCGAHGERLSAISAGITFTTFCWRGCPRTWCRRSIFRLAHVAADCG